MLLSLSLSLPPLQNPPPIRIASHRIASPQQLKDAGKEFGRVEFADITRDGIGLIVFPILNDLRAFCRKYDNREFNGALIRVDEVS